MSLPVVLFQWQPGSNFGWGIYGLNLLLNWAGRPDFRVCSTFGVAADTLDINALEQARIRNALAASQHIAGHMLQQGAGRRVEYPALVLDALGTRLHPCPNGAWAVGKPSLGVVFCESWNFDADTMARAAHYAGFIAGSSWGQRMLAEAGIGPVNTVLQGVDLTRFHPAPRMQAFPNRFVVFTGGKIEFRKGQDLVIKAFRAFAQSHRDAVLLTAWDSPWPEMALDFNRHTDLAPLALNAQGQLDLYGWTRANGIPSDQVFHLPVTPNSAMPRILREADAALFVSRAEAGTNLVAMEAMACGVPTILSANTGHLDLIAEDRCYALGRQIQSAVPTERDWGTSDVDEIVAVLENIYQQRATAATRGAEGARFMAGLGWPAQTEKLASVIKPYLA